ncbi:MAG: transporter substrate-binding domain-containing protein [Methyloligellaceae bacterium]
MRHKIGLFGIAVAIAFLSGPSVHAEDKPLKVALDGTFAPHAMPKLDGGVEGFNVDLAKEIGRRLNRKIEITAAQWSGLIPALQAGTYDFLVAPTTVTKERAKNLLFTEGYLNTDYQFLVSKEAPEATKLEDFKGKVVAVNKGSAYDKWARGLAGKIGWTVQSYGTNTDAVQAVLAGRAYANVAGNTVIAWAVKKNARLKLSYLHSTGRVFAMPFRKDDVAMRNKVEGIIECMKLDGTIGKMSEKWFGVTPGPGSAAKTVYAGFGVPGLRGHEATKHTPACK